MPMIAIMAKLPFVNPAANISSRTRAAASPSTGPSRPQALFVRSTWKNMPMIATMAKRPFANSAANLFFSNAHSGESEYKAQ